MTIHSDHGSGKGYTVTYYGEKERLEYMESINAITGELRTVDRNNVYEDVVDMYRTGDVVGECLSTVKICIPLSGKKPIPSCLREPLVLFL